MNLVIQKSGNKEYVSFRESYWDPVRKKITSRTVKNFGRLDLLLEKDPDILDKLRAEVERVAKERQQTKEANVQKRVRDVLDPLAHSSASTVDNRLINLGSCVYRQIWNRLDLSRKLRSFIAKTKDSFNFADAVFYLTSARLLNPDSKLAPWATRQHFLYGGQDLHLNHLYRAAELLGQFKAPLIQYLNRQIEKDDSRTRSVALCVVSTFYFDSQDADTLESVDYLKVHRIDPVPVVMGLFMDSQGIPIDYELWPQKRGALSDLVPWMKNLQKKHNIEKVIVVADSSQDEGSNLLALQAAGLDYAISYRLRSHADHVLACIRDEANWTKRAFPCQPSYQTTETRRVRTLKPTTCAVSDRSVTSNLLLSYSVKRVRQAADDRVRQLEKGGQHVCALPSELKGCEAKTLQEQGACNRVDLEWALAGYEGLCYSDKTWSPEFVTQLHQSLGELNAAFKISKRLLEATSGLRWTEKRIRGHVAICYLALVLQRLLEADIHQAGEHFSTEAIIEALRQATVQEIATPMNEKVYAKSNTHGIFETISAIEGLKRLPTVARSIDVKRAFKLKEI